jgi:hypothetical protein
MKRDWSVLSINIGLSPFVWRWYIATRCPVFAAQRGLFINLGPLDIYFALFLEIPKAGFLQENEVYEAMMQPEDDPVSDEWNHK